MNQVKANRVIALKLKLNKHNKSAAPKKIYWNVFWINDVNDFSVGTITCYTSK